MKLYGYGIVDKDDAPWWGEDWCVCKDREQLDDEALELNDAKSGTIHDSRRPYRVVQLLFREPRAKRSKP